MNAWSKHRLMSLAAVVTAGVVLVGCGGGPQEEPSPGKETAPKSQPSGDEASGSGASEGISAETAVFWSNSAGEYVEGTTIDINCPAGGTLAAPIWGGDDGIYTDDSAICVAAVHAGLITVDDGGAVVIEKTAGQDGYGEGFTANGVTSLPWPDPWSGSFIFPES